MRIKGAPCQVTKRLQLGMKKFRPQLQLNPVDTDPIELVDFDFRTGKRRDCDTFVF